MADDDDPDDAFDVPVRVTIRDTVTGDEREGMKGMCTWWWAEGNGSCDCNRELAFKPIEKLEGGTCAGYLRYRIVAVDPLLPGYTLADFNQGYPEPP